MPYKKYLQEAGCILSYSRYQRSASARLAALILLFSLSVSFAAPVAAAACPQITSISTAKEQQSRSRPEDGWFEVTLPDNWKQRQPKHEGAVWYRIQWHNDCESSEALALAVSSMTMAGAVYLNDHLLWRDAGLEEPFSRSWNMPRYWLLPNIALAHTDNTLWFRIVGHGQDVLGLGQVAVGDPVSIGALHKQQVWEQRDLFTLNMIISLVLGCLFLIMWAVQRQERAFGWYALASLLWAVFAGTLLASSPWPFSGSMNWNRAVVTVFTIYCSAFCLFTWSFGEQHLPRLARGLWGMTLASALVVWMAPESRLYTVMGTIGMLYVLIFMANCIQFQSHAWRHRHRHNVLLALCLLLFLVISLRDSLVIVGLLDGSQLYAPITSLIAMIFMFSIIADRFSENFRRIESFNIDLQAAVNTTRRELTETLQRKHQLESSNIRLTERLRFAHDLHDSLGSSLMRSIATVEQSSAPLSNTRMLSMLKELRDDLRQIIDNSSPSSTSESTTPAEWIAPLRHRFVRLFDELELRSQWALPATWPCQLSAVKLLTLTRFIEEALTNAIKHSRGDKLEVAMQSTADGGLILQVCDNGIGFDVADISTGSGVGMRSMHARIARIGGQLDIQSRPGETRLKVFLAN